MRATITDGELISALNPLNFSAYLLSKGWTKYSEEVGKYSVWVHPKHSNSEIVLPYNRQASDFVGQLSSALLELEIVEDRSQLFIVRDLLVDQQACKGRKAAQRHQARQDME